MECQSLYVMLKREVIVHLVLEEEEGEDGVEDRVVAGAEVSPFFFYEQHEPSLFLPPTPLSLSLSVGGPSPGKARNSGSIQEFRGSKMTFDSD